MLSFWSSVRCDWPYCIQMRVERELDWNRCVNEGKITELKEPHMMWKLTFQAKLGLGKAKEKKYTY